MSNDQVGWEGWALVIIALGGVPAGLLFLPIVGVFGGTSHPRYRPAPPSPLPLDPSRLVMGVGLALLLVVAAAWLIRRTDWDPSLHQDDR